MAGEKRSIPVYTTDIGEREVALVAECVRTGWISAEGPMVARFEKEFAASVGRTFGVAVSNGTVALELMLHATGISPGDEVIIPTFTIVSCLAAVIRVGAVPVLVDCDPITWCMDVSQVERKITPRTKAIMPVHIYGLPVNMEPLLELASRHNLLIVEDAAEAHGLSYNGKACGSFGIASTFSFYANKMVTTGEGGMVLTDDLKIAEKLRSLRNLCFTTTQRFVHQELGFNARMSAIQAALGVAQLESLADRIARKRAVAHRYNTLLRTLPQISLHPEMTQYAENVYWVYGIVLNDSLRYDARELASRLADAGIATRPFFWPMHQQPFLKDKGWCSGDSFPVAERLARRGLYLPSGSTLQQDDIEYVATTLRQILER